MSFFSKHKFLCVLLIFLLIATIFITMVFASPLSANIGSDWSKLNFDVKLIRLNTDIDVYKDNAKIGNVNGRIIRFITDPLTYYGVDGQKLAYANDTYHFIAQDSHAVVVDGNVTIEMVGKVRFLGEAYDIYDSAGNKIAYAEFDCWNVNGRVVDNNGKALAVYRANPIFRDFTVYISPDCTIDESSMVMLFCSYYSDHAEDSDSSSDSSSD